MFKIGLANLIVFIIFLSLLQLNSAIAEKKFLTPNKTKQELEIPNCKKTTASDLAVSGFELQQNNKTSEAIEKYSQALSIDNECWMVMYELGWSYWKLGDWQKVVELWEKVLVMQPSHKKIKDFLSTAKANKEIVKTGATHKVFRKSTDIFSQSLPKESPIQLTLINRWQSYEKKTIIENDHYDEDIFSPKSVQFSKHLNKVYVHSLEGHKTVIFNQDGSKKENIIQHNIIMDYYKKNIITKTPPFNYSKNTKLALPFKGKPVESILTHNDKYLWITYYRRSFDSLGQYPSAVAIVNTETNKIERIMSTGPIAKYIETSADKKWVAIANWGDNTVGIYDIQSAQAKDFKEHQLLVVEKKHSLINLKSNRDKDCGFCVRGLAFSKNSDYLFVARMKGGGIAIFKINSTGQFTYKGTVFGIQPGPRDLHLSHDGDYLFSGCNATGTIAKTPVKNLIELAENSSSTHIEIPENFKFQKVFVGLGTRSFKLHPSLDYLFATSNQGSEISILSTQDLKIYGRVPVDSYPVGLGISPDGKYLWATSQGRESQGGNSVSVFLITEYLKNQIK